MDTKKFLNPPNEYRAAPFWSWNDDLTNEELERQLRDYGDKGWGGGFMHSRVGLITPYLEEEWMDHIAHTVGVGAETGMLTWLYDEDKWPSGYAGGRVPEIGAHMRNCALVRTFEKPDFPPHDYRILAIYAKNDNGNDNENEIQNDWEEIEDGSKANGRRVMYISHATEGMGNVWFNDTAYVDLMNPEATQAFFDSTLEPYADLVGHEFGKAIRGIFTDEPTYKFPHGFLNDREALPWTPKFPEEFQDRRGYDLIPHLHQLFEDTGQFHKVRYDLFQTATELFVENFTKPYGEWCEEHGLVLTGHLLMEDTFGRQCDASGACMPHYEYMQWPGIDHLSRNIDFVATAKQCTSVAHQLGKERVLSEMFGCSGQDFSLEEQKWIIDWHLIHGINYVNPHLSLYSMRGERKRDYPPTLSYQQPWWSHNNLIADYTGRLCYALTQGKRVTRTLLLHSIESAWALFKPYRGWATVDVYAKSLEETSRWLLNLNVDFDYGDETLIAKYGDLDDDGSFALKECSYDTVVIPPCLTLRSTTLELLDRFVEAGGRLITLKSLPTLVDGKPSDNIWHTLGKGEVVEYDIVEFTKALSQIERDVDIRSASGYTVDDIWYHHRLDGDSHIYFLANTDRTKGYEVDVMLEGVGECRIWDLSDGTSAVIPSETYDGNTLLSLTFEPVGSFLISIDTSKAEFDGDDELSVGPDPIVEYELALPDSWNVKRSAPNSLTLDYAKLKWGDGDWSELRPLWKIREEVQKRTGHFSVEYPFAVSCALQNDIRAVVEMAAEYDISLNGHKLTPDGGWWLDMNFSTLNLAGLTVEGSNSLVVKGIASKDVEVEDAYIIGDFGVWSDDLLTFHIDREIGDEKERHFEGGDLTHQGYPFFAGTIDLSQTVDLGSLDGRGVLVELDGLEATVASVTINGKKVADFGWRPYAVEITDHVTDGENEITISLVSTLRNLLGPLHHKRGELFSVGPESFASDINWTDVYQFVPFSLDQVRLVFTRELAEMSHNEDAHDNDAHEGHSHA